MNMMIRPFMPYMLGMDTDAWLLVVNLVLITSITVLIAFLIGRYAANEWNGNKRKTVFCFIGISVAAVMLLCYFFGLSASTVRGIIFCLILLLSSYSDMKTRECADYLHVMILLAAFICRDFTELPSMLLSAMFVGGVMLLALLLGKGRSVGGADIKLSVSCAFMLGLTQSVMGLLAGMITAVIVNSVKNRKNKKVGFPLIPYLAAGFMAAYFI